jgi:hypothetical protein
MVVVVVVGLIVMPGRTWVDQQLALDDAGAELRDVRAENDELEAKIERLSEDRSIERQARAEFGLVYPGEESYMVPPPGPPTVNLPRVWPFDLLQEPLARAAQRSGSAEADDRSPRDGS